VVVVRVPVVGGGRLLEVKLGHAESAYTSGGKEAQAGHTTHTLPQSEMIASRLIVASLLICVIFAVPCLSLSRIACNNVKQGMDVTGNYSTAFAVPFDNYLQELFALRILQMACATSKTR
jgi:hypothetical protein